jgi:hypothetical protein
MFIFKRRTGDTAGREVAVKWVRDLHKSLYKYTIGQYQALGETLDQDYGLDEQAVEVWKKQVRVHAISRSREKET